MEHRYNCVAYICLCITALLLTSGLFRLAEDFTGRKAEDVDVCPLDVVEACLVQFGG